MYVICSLQRTQSYLYLQHTLKIPVILVLNLFSITPSLSNFPLAHAPLTLNKL